MSIDTNVMCKGAWRLGTACGMCQRCADSMGDAVQEIHDLRTQLSRRKVKRQVACALLIKPKSDGYDWQIMLDVVESQDIATAKAGFGMLALESWPGYGLHKVMAMDVE